MALDFSEKRFKNPAMLWEMTAGHRTEACVGVRPGWYDPWNIPG
jgi:hypothetical protein